MTLGCALRYQRVYNIHEALEMNAKLKGCLACNVQNFS